MFLDPADSRDEALCEYAVSHGAGKCSSDEQLRRLFCSEMEVLQTLPTKSQKNSRLASWLVSSLCIIMYSQTHHPHVMIHSFSYTGNCKSLEELDGVSTTRCNLVGQFSADKWAIYN